MRKALIRVDEIPEGGATAVQVETATGGFSLILTRVDGVVHAFHNECPHAGRRLDWSPGKFLIEGRLLICAVHGATFGLASGDGVAGPCRGTGLKPVPVTIDNGEVCLG